MPGPFDRLKRVFNPIASAITAPVRAYNYIFDVQTANYGWDTPLEKPKLSPERKRELLETSSLETPRSSWRAVAGVFMPYWGKAGKKEAAISAGLLASSIFISYLMVKQQVDFTYLSGELFDLTQNMASAVESSRPALFDNLIVNYPDLQQLLADNPVLNQMLHIFPDVTSYPQVPEIAEFLRKDQATFRDWMNFLRNAPSIEDVLMKFPGMAEAVEKNPAILDQLNTLQAELGSKLYEQNSGDFGHMLSLCFTDFFTNWGNAFNAVAADPLNSFEGFKQGVSNAFNDAVKGTTWNPLDVVASWLAFGIRTGVSALGPQAQAALSDAWQSKDFMNIVMKFMPLAIASYKTAQTAALRWRAWTTGYYVNKWLNNKAFDRLKHQFSNIDNPDQRIQDDPYRFTGGAVGVIKSATSTLMSFTAYAGILWGLSNWNLAYFGGPNYVLEGTMFWLGLTYAATLTGLTIAAGYKLPELTRNQQRREANFRNALKNVQDNTDSVALNSSETVEKDLIRKQYAPVLNNQVRQISTSIRMSIVDATFGNFSIPVPMLAGAFSIATGTLSMGTTSILDRSFGAVTGAMSYFANAFGTFADLKAIADRLFIFDKAMDAAAYLEEEKRQAGLTLAPR